MPSFKSILASTLSAIVFATTARADFPGSTVGISWNSTSPYGQSVGNISLVETSTGGYVMTLANGPSNLTAFFGGPTGQGAALLMACPYQDYVAYLIPTTEPISTPAKYYLEWSTDYSSLPNGTLANAFVFGPAPTYDTLMVVNGANGIWLTIEIDGQYVIGWANETYNQNGDVQLWLPVNDDPATTC